MAISYVSVGTVADNANTVTPSLPTGFAAGQLAILQVVSGHPSDPTQREALRDAVGVLLGELEGAPVAA